MNTLLLCLCFLFVAIILVSSEPFVPLRGALKEVEQSDLGDSGTKIDNNKNELNKENTQDSKDLSLKIPDSKVDISGKNTQSSSNVQEKSGKENTDNITDTNVIKDVEDDNDNSNHKRNNEVITGTSSGSDGSVAAGESGQPDESGSIDEPEDQETDETGSSQSTVTETATKDTSNAQTNASEPTETSECDNSFIMWFSNGVAVTTIHCKEYSVIYTGKENGQSESKYLKGDIEKVEIETTGTINVNDVPLSDISSDPSKPTDNSEESLSRMRLIIEEENEVLKNVEVYSFPIGDREITVKLPNSDKAEKRDKYTLSSGDETFYSGSGNNSKYSIKDNGDLVDSTGKVVLKGDSSSSAIKNIYSVSSLFAVLISVLIF